MSHDLFGGSCDMDSSSVCLKHGLVGMQASQMLPVICCSHGVTQCSWIADKFSPSLLILYDLCTIYKMIASYSHRVYCMVVCLKHFQHLFSLHIVAFG
jgi:hypothetical protein